MAFVLRFAHAGGINTSAYAQPVAVVLDLYKLFAGHLDGKEIKNELRKSIMRLRG